jgi:hypothetical protein
MRNESFDAMHRIARRKDVRNHFDSAQRPDVLKLLAQLAAEADMYVHGIGS